MKISTFLNAIGFGFLLCGAYTGGAQQVSSSMPIVVQLAEIDRYHVYVHRPEKPLSGSNLSLVFKDLEQSKVEELVRSGLLLHSSVWVMDGQKLLVKGGLAGMAICQGDKKGKEEYGLLLSFDSTDEAEKAAAMVKLEPDSSGVDLQQKK
jgi:hypothetical protein